MNIELLRTKLETLQSEASRIKASGEILKGVRLEKTHGGGNCSASAQTTYLYARLRCGKGKALAGGARSKYVALGEIGKTEAAIARGKELSKIEKAIAALQTKLAKLELKATAIGLGF
jgi:hypothetical protein